MKKLIIAAIMFALCSVPVFAHHAAEGYTDDEVYEMIEGLVADTPHADMTIADLGAGMTESTLTAPTTVSLEKMLDEGLLTYLQMLDGEVTVTIVFNDDHSVTMTVLQVVVLDAELDEEEEEEVDVD